MQLFVLGATGGTDRELIGQALGRRHRITAFVRNRQKLAEREGLTVVQGDLLNAEALSVALAGQDAVVSAVGPTGLGRTTIMRDSARVAMQAMKAAGVTRLLILSVAVLFDDAGRDPELQYSRRCRGADQEGIGTALRSIGGIARNQRLNTEDERLSAIDMLRLILKTERCPSGSRSTLGN